MNKKKKGFGVGKDAIVILSELIFTQRSSTILMEIRVHELEDVFAFQMLTIKSSEVVERYKHSPRFATLNITVLW